MNELALFAGAGGGILGSKLLGWRTVCAVEIEPYPISVLLQRQNDGILPPFPIWDNIKTFDGRPWSGIVDVISGGFPCQAFSKAARGRNTAENLWCEMRRVISEVKPKYVFAENVSETAIESACIDLESMGYKTNAISLGAEDLGGDHVRKRYWLLAYSNNKSELLCKINAEVAVRSIFCNSVWATEPDKSGMVNGMAPRVERYTAIGNGQIPIVAVGALISLCLN